MSGVPGTVGRSDWVLPRAPGRPKPRRESRLDSVRVPPLVLRTLPFLALAVFAGAHWTALVDPAQTRRALVVALIVTAGGVLISLSGRLPRGAGIPARLLLTGLMLLFALAAIGIRFKLLMPAGWSTLGDRVSGGLSVVGSVSEWPYGGPNVWLRLTTLLAAPLVLVLASLLAFWPRRGDGPQANSRTALILLVGLYAVAVASRPFGHQGLRGLGLLACLVAWLWLPRLRGRDALAATSAVAAAAVIALLLTPKVAATQPWVDYHHWSWSLRKEKTISFNWRQTYGPLHWPRKGTTLLLIRSKQPHYWKAQTLDRFDGFGWTSAGLADSGPTYANGAVTNNPKWIQTVHVTVRGLSSQVVIGPGSLLDVQGVPGDTIKLSDETALTSGQLSSGDTYTVRGYTPDPSARQMRAAPAPAQFFEKYTTVELPSASGFTASFLHVPLRAEPHTGDPAAPATLAGSVYAPMYALARRVAGNARTDYDVVQRVGAWLQAHYAYSERVPQHRYPLEAFLFQDKRGYCQQFSGAAALMLRMLGVPTRVAAGFAPGELNSDTREYVVRDLDAHSWIEVWFQGIGWVPFDPTPAIAPAASQATSFESLNGNASAANGDSRDRIPKKRLDQLAGVSVNGISSAHTAGQHHTQWGWIIAGVVFGLLALAALVVTLLRWRSGRRPLPAPCGDPDVDHLVRMLGRLGLDVPPGTTLLDLEQRMQRLGGDDAAAYARALRRRRFGRGQVPAPGRAERRQMRHLLAKATGAGPLARVHLAMPDNLRH